MTGFVAGTLVHTEKGLVPIQEIKVGDRVLSRHVSSKGPTEYKQVIKAFKQDVKHPVMSPLKLSNILCTEEHPFWVKDRGWIPANQIDERATIEYLLHLPNHDISDLGRYDHLNGMDSIEDMDFHIWDSRIDNLAIIPKTNEWKYNNEIHYGYELIDFSSGKPRIVLLDINDYSGLSVFIQNSFDPNTISDKDKLDYSLLYKDKDKELITKYRELFYYGVAGGVGKPYFTYVYNIDVEDFHTYFVGEEGLWVHC
ncbi:hypothetical protein BJD20_05370 [Acinetobacter proteolyticus]|uniref:Hint domain-containing protein n=1 Tax=Acinetobacter proteolyticus TaxID=1776741 RepID=UPI000863236E|nr:Hint domain-containing protein [Acinetobacter proteolyticus]OEY92780.1 hypothetical protein BJD20_05370 [Acinetobacter proteolyticus]